MRCPHCQQVMPSYPRNAGKAWTRWADANLHAFATIYRTRNVRVEEAIPWIAQHFERSYASIYARLLKLDLITE